ncbi:MAG: serine/threonine-protein phosphatase [Bacteroidales bacterium]|nr:serine/threonine-protein phosphatase [Candidatus Physcousia equi]
MKQILFIIVVAVLVFAATLMTTNRYMKQEAIEEADSAISRILDNFVDDLDNDLKMTRNAVYGFLSGVFTKPTEDSDGCLLVEGEWKDLDVEQLRHKLSSFMKANPYYTSAMFIFEKDPDVAVSQNTFYAPMIEQGSDSLEDVGLRHDFTRSANLEQCCNTLQAFWTVPSQQSTVHGELVVFYVPLCRKEDGRFMGAFALHVSVSKINDKCKRHAPYGSQSELVLATESGEIIAAYPSTYTHYTSLKSIKKFLADTYDYREVEHDGEKTVVDIQGTRWFLYNRLLRCAPWRVLTCCKTSSIYARADLQGKVLLLTSLVGFLLMLGASVVISLLVRRTHNARLVAEQELTMAAAVQTKLLRQPEFISPTASLHAFIRPAREAGGDLYDYAEVDGKLIFCIGDVSGKGMPAALFMTQVVSLFRNTIRQTCDPSAIVSSINDVLADTNPDMTFCTLFVGILDDDKLYFCNAGHNKPILLPTKAPCSFIEQNPNVAVGLLGGFPYASEELKMEAGSTLLLYTDGVTEAKNLHNEYWGEQALLNVLAHSRANTPQQEIDAIMAELTAFVGHAPQSDDITIVALHRV